MPKNTGFLTADTTVKGDETFTPAYAVQPIIKYINKNLIVWCPFDEEWSSFVKVLKDNKIKVIYSHIKDGKDFFEYEPKEYDIIISNPPFSKKDEVLKRLAQLNKPYAMLLPLQVLQGQKRFEEIKDCQALIFDKRVKYYQNGNNIRLNGSPAFASIYLCKDFLPKDLIFEKLNIIDGKLADYLIQ